jgi:hypothetical protein
MAPGEPYFRYVKWQTRSDGQLVQRRPIELNESAVRCLAALAGRGDVEATGVSDLPPRSACKLVELNGGFAVLAYRGCLVVDDWRDESLPELEMLGALERAARWCAALETHLKELRGLETTFEEWIGSGQPEDSASHALIGRVVQARVRFAGARAAGAGESVVDAGARFLYETMMSFWRTADREGHIDRGYERLERSVRALHEVRPALLLRLIGLIGFPAFVAPSIAKPLVALANTTLLGAGVVIHCSGQTAESLITIAEGATWLLVTLGLYYLSKHLISRWDPTVPKAADN